MSLNNFLPIVIPQVFYLAESKADLSQVETFINQVEQNFFRLRRPNGGSSEYWEAIMTMGDQTMGIRYVSPREGFIGKDAFVVTAFFGRNQTFTRLNLEFNPGESKESATSRWIALAQSALSAASLYAQLPYDSIQGL